MTDGRHITGRAPVVIALGLLLLLLLLAAPSGALAEEEEIVFGRREQLPPVGIKNVAGWFEFYTSRETDQAKPTTGNGNGTGGLKTTDQLLRETIGLSAQSYIIHPNLVDLSLGGSFGLEQESLTGGGPSTGVPGSGSQKIDSRVEQYDVSATILRKELAPLTLYLRRTDDVVTRPFGGSFSNVSSTEGGRWDIRSRSVPTQFEFYRQSQQLTAFGTSTAPGFGSLSNYALTEDVFQWHSEAKPTEHQQLSWDYSMHDLTQSNGSVGAPTSNFRTDQATAAHALMFGPSDVHSLNSVLTVLKETGDLMADRLRWNEDLRLQHTPKLSTDYHYVLNQDQTQFSSRASPAATASAGTSTSSQTLQRETAGFMHQLFSSLITTGHVGASQLGLDQGAKTDEVFADLGWAYTKKVPLGRLSLNLDLATDTQENTVRTAPTLITGEAHSFTDPNPVVLSHAHIIVSSIVVRAAKGFFMFASGVDYTVLSFPDRVELHRFIAGAIADGDAVLIDYTIEPEPGSLVKTHSVGVGGRYSFEEWYLRGLSVYARALKQDQTVTPLDPKAPPPDSLTDRTLGAEYRLWDLTLRAENEVHDSVISPFNANRTSANFSHRMENGLTIGLSAAQTKIQYTDLTGGQSSYTDLSARLEQQLSRELFWNASVNWRDEQLRQNDRTKGIEEQFELRWQRRQTAVFLMLRNVQLNTTSQDSQFQSIQLGIRRDF